MINGVIYSANAPTESQKTQLEELLSKRYCKTVTLEFFEDKSVGNGFILKIDKDTYDFSAKGRFEQMKSMLLELDFDSEDIIPIMQKAVDEFTPRITAKQTGYVQSVCDGIATVTGLEGTFFGEILVFENGIRGMVQNLTETEAGCILFDNSTSVTQGIKAYRTGKVAAVPVGDALLGRVVDALGNPIDGLGEIATDKYRKVEAPAPAIIDRSPVNRPLETGILAIDSMFPIGRGQRELIIGDRQTGKTAIALDTIINQKGKNVICVFAAIGQKSSSVASLVSTLERHGALEYTIVVSAGASESAPLQYIAPYAATAIAEHFMDLGKDVLIVYDDLSKHAVAYRALSLLLGRSPGREAYPGDVFYLHSRLLERSAQLSPERGGGSLTALPIVETQAGDVSAYIPTNIISITDGQIFLESDLFFSGQRPAVNIGLSVSRVGKDAQTKAMKKAAGTLRLDLAQYREMKVFTQFSSDLDTSTKRALVYGAGLMQILRQNIHSPYSLAEQVVLLVAAHARCFEALPELKIKDVATALINKFTTDKPIICKQIASSGEITDAQREQIELFALQFVKEYMN